jgi:GAF domain-containing protein
MLRRIWQFFTVVEYPYTNPVQQQARSLLFFVSTTSIFLIGSLYLLLALGLLRSSPTTTASLAVAPFAGLAIIWLVKIGRFTWAVAVLLVIISLSVFSNVATGIRSLTAISVLSPLVVTTLFANRRVTLLMGFLTLVVLFLGYFTIDRINIVVTTAERLPNFLNNAVAIMFVVALLYSLGTNLQTLVNSYSTSIADLRRSVNASELNELQLDETDILTQTLKNFRNGFGYSFVQIYLLDDTRRTAQRLYLGFGLDTLQEGDSFDIATANAVGECLRTNTLIPINANSSETRRRHLSAGMMGGVVIPIEYEGKAIGALDLQSDRLIALSDTQVEVLQLYSNRLATALVRARVLKQLREDLREQELIIIKQRQRLREFEQAEHSIIPNSTWETYFQQNIHGLVGFNVDGRTAKLTAADDLSLTMRESLEKGELVVMTENNQQIASVPIFLREQLLGAMSFRLPRNTVLTERQRELLNSVVQRLALALENKRLFEQSQTQAIRESKANEIASLLLSTTDINTVLQLAAESFNEALGAIRTEVYLQQDQEGELR